MNPAPPVIKILFATVYFRNKKQNSTLHLRAAKREVFNVPRRLVISDGRSLYFSAA
jgi:hypothetical protein